MIPYNRLAPNVVRGGTAIPLGNNFYYMRGRKHKNGGIDIGENPKTGLEVEGGEVMEMRPNEVRVYSSVPFLNGQSPAKLVLGGANADVVFNAQEQYKDINKINDDGTKYKCGGRRKAEIGTVKSDNTNIAKPIIQDFIPATDAELLRRKILANEAKYAKGNLEIVSPEFDLLTGIRGLANLPKNFFNIKDVKDISTNYYRQGNNIINDAKKTGLINVNSSAAKGKDVILNGKKFTLRKTFDVPFWAKGQKWYGDKNNLDVIVSKGNNGFDWIPINQHGKITNLEKAGTRRTPLIDGKVGNTPIENLLFYKKYPIFGYGNVTNGEANLPITGLNLLHETINKNTKDDKMKYGGNIIVSINGNVKNGLIHTTMKCGGRKKAAYGSYDNMSGIPRAYYILGRHRKNKPIGLKEKEIEDIKELETIPNPKELETIPNPKELETIPIDKNKIPKEDKPENVGKVYHDISFDAMTGLLRSIGRKIDYNYTRHGNTNFRTADLDDAIFTNRPDTVKNITSIYGNDFAYHSPETASARQVKEFKDINAKDIDGKIPISKISRYYGTDKTGKFKIGSLSDFADDDYVAAIRNKSMPFNDVAIVNGKLIYYKDGIPIKSSLPEGENNKHIVYNPVTGRKQFVSTTRDINKLYNFYKQFLSTNKGYADIVLLDNGRFEDNIYKGGRNLTDDEISDYYRNDFRRKGSFTSVPVIIEGNMKKYGGRKKADYGLSYFAPSLFGPKYDKVVDLNPDGTRSERSLLYADATNPNASYADILLNNEFEGYSVLGDFSNRRIKYTPVITTETSPTSTELSAPAISSSVSTTKTNTGTEKQKSLPAISRVTTRFSDLAKVPDVKANIPVIPKQVVVNNDNNKSFLPLRGVRPEDWISLGTNLASTIGGSLIGANTEVTAPELPEVAAPTLITPGNLKTYFNINPQLATINRTALSRIADINRNTSSSRTALARKQRVANQAVADINNLYGQKENIETELYNKNVANKQAVAAQNAQIYNTYLNNVFNRNLEQIKLKYAADYENTRNKAIAYNNLLSGANASIQDLINRLETRRKDKNTLAAVAARSKDAAEFIKTLKPFE